MTVVQDFVIWDYSTSANASAHNDSGGRGPAVIAPRLVGAERSGVGAAGDAAIHCSSSVIVWIASRSFVGDGAAPPRRLAAAFCGRPFFVQNLLPIKNL